MTVLPLGPVFEVPGASETAAARFRAVGSLPSDSEVTVVAFCCVWEIVSRCATTTASAAIEEIPIEIWTGVDWAADSLTCRVTVWKPDIVNVTLYSPGGRSGRMKSPLTEVTAVRVPWRFGDLTVTVTPGRPCPSFRTRPVRVDCGTP